MTGDPLQYVMLVKHGIDIEVEYDWARIHSEAAKLGYSIQMGCSAVQWYLRAQFYAAQKANKA